MHELVMTTAQTYVQGGVGNQVRADNTPSGHISCSAWCFHGNGDCNQIALAQLLAACHDPCSMDAGITVCRRSQQTCYATAQQLTCALLHEVSAHTNIQIQFGAE